MLEAKYRPLTTEQVIGQKNIITRVLNWFGKPKNALILYGRPGIGKNVIVEVVAKELNYRVIRADLDKEGELEYLNSIASNKTLFGKFLILVDGVDCAPNKRELKEKLEKLALSTRVPVILIANDIYNKNLKSLRKICETINVNPLSKLEIGKQLTSITTLEKISMEQTQLDTIATLSKGDLRSAINDLESTINYSEVERERETTLFEALDQIFKYNSLNGAINAVDLCSRDINEIMLWVAESVANSPDPEKRAKAFEALSKADLLRQKSRESYIKWLTCSVALHKLKVSEYSLPKLFLINRTHEESLIDQKELHCSRRKLVEQTPYLNLILK